jgi:hypothetical protein
VETPPEDKPAPKTMAEKYEASAGRLQKEADRLVKRIPKLPEQQRAAAQALADAKRRLAEIKTEAAALWKSHLGELPEEFKPKLREAQSKHSAALKEYYRIGRELKAAAKSKESATNFIAPASIFGK